MNEENDIVATATTDAPEILDSDSLDAVTAGVEYGGTNTCEPVKPKGGDWIQILSFSWSSPGLMDGHGLGDSSLSAAVPKLKAR